MDLPRFGGKQAPRAVVDSAGMTAGMSFADLIAYTDWQRLKWREWLHSHPEALAVGAGPNRDGRFETVGDLIRHIFSAEKRYIDRLSGRPIAETGDVPSGDPGALFELGQQSRTDLREFIERFPAEEWDTMLEFPLMKSLLLTTPRKIIAHVLLHEVRHWAQIATICRLNGLATEMQDLILSPAMGGEFKRGGATPKQ